MGEKRLFLWGLAFDTTLSLSATAFYFWFISEPPNWYQTFVWLCLTRYRCSPGWPGTHHAAQDGLKLETLLSLPCAEIVRCHSWTRFKLFPLYFIGHLLSMYGAYECMVCAHRVHRRTLGFLLCHSLPYFPRQSSLLLNWLASKLSKSAGLQLPVEL